MRLDTLAFLKRNPAVVLCIFILLYTIVLSYFAILRHHAFMSTAWDLGIYEQVLWSTVNTGRLFWYTPEIVINPSCCFFGIHFSPILFLVLPVYALFQTTESLLVLQVFFLAVGAVPLYKLAIYETYSPKQALVFASLYLVYPPIHGVAFFDFHVQAFLPFLFFSAFYYFKKEEWEKYFLFIVLSLMVIEFVSLIVVFFGLYGLWTKKKKIFDLVRTSDFKELLSNKGVFFCSFTILLGLIWFIVARNVISGINPSAPPHPNWETFGDPIHNLPEFVFNVLANPIKTLEVVFTPFGQKAVYIFGLFAPLAFLSFLDLPSLMIGAPWFLVAFLSNYASYYAPIGYQYVAFVVPFVFISAVYGVKRLFSVVHRFGFCKKLGVVFAKFAVSQPWRTLSILFLIFIVAIAYVKVLDIFVTVPLVTEHNRVAEYFTKLIPSNASVLTQNDLFPHLSRRLYAYVEAFNQSFPSNLAFDYVLIDTNTPWYTASFEKLVCNLTRNGIFGLQYAADGMWLLKKNYTGEIFYPIQNGVLVNFHNQGLLMKLFDDVSMIDEPIYENVTSSTCCSSGFNLSHKCGVTGFFALVFEGWLYSPISGNYSFQMESIAGSSQFFLDNGEVLLSINTTSYETDCVTVRLEKGFHSIKIKYIRESYSFPFVCLLWKPPWEINMMEIQSSFLYPKILPDTSSPFLNMNWDSGFKCPFALIDQKHLSVLINGGIYAFSSGVYRFRVLTGGYTSLFIDATLVYSSFRNSNQTEFEVFLSRGTHTIQVDHMSIQGNSRLSLMWQPPGSERLDEIPSSNLSWKEG